MSRQSQNKNSGSGEEDDRQATDDQKSSLSFELRLAKNENRKSF